MVSTPNSYICTIPIGRFNNTTSLGILYSLPIQIQGAVVHADLFVLDRYSALKAPIILGRPFLWSAKARINMATEIIRFSFDGRNMTLKFQPEKGKWYSSNGDYRTKHQRKVDEQKEKRNAMRSCKNTQQKPTISQLPVNWKLKRVPRYGRWKVLSHLTRTLHLYNQSQPEEVLLVGLINVEPFPKVNRYASCI